MLVIDQITGETIEATGNHAKAVNFQPATLPDTLTAEQKTLVREFVKNKKFGTAAVGEFAVALLATMPKPAMQSTLVSQKAPRNSALAVRTAIRAMANNPESKGKHFTAKQLAEAFNCSPVEANTALNFLSKNEKIVRIVGQVNDWCVRGKKPALWGFN